MQFMYATEYIRVRAFAVHTLEIEKWMKTSSNLDLQPAGEQL